MHWPATPPLISSSASDHLTADHTARHSCCRHMHACVHAPHTPHRQPSRSGVESNDSNAHYLVLNTHRLRSLGLLHTVEPRHGRKPATHTHTPHHTTHPANGRKQTHADAITACCAASLGRRRPLLHTHTHRRAQHNYYSHTHVRAHARVYLHCVQLLAAGVPAAASPAVGLRLSGSLTASGPPSFLDCCCCLLRPAALLLPAWPTSLPAFWLLLLP